MIQSTNICEAFTMCPSTGNEQSHLVPPQLHDAHVVIIIPFYRLGNQGITDEEAKCYRSKIE